MVQTPSFQSPYNPGTPYNTNFISGLVPQFGTTTTLTLSAGYARDTADKSNITLASQVTINGAVNGINGLDTGALANTTWYYVFVCADSTGVKATGGLISTSATAPTMPAGYDMIRLVGYWVTNGSAQFINGYYFGSSNNRKFIYDAVQSVLASGTQTTFTAVSCTNFVPPIDNTPVTLDLAFTPNAAGDAANIRPTGSSSTAGSTIITGVVATKAQQAQLPALTKLSSSVAKFDYKVATSGSLNAGVVGFEVAV